MLFCVLAMLTTPTIATPTQSGGRTETAGQTGTEWLVRQVRNGWSDRYGMVGQTGKEWLVRQVRNGWSDR
jgi:hypothetical protein